MTMSLCSGAGYPVRIRGGRFSRPEYGHGAAWLVRPETLPPARLRAAARAATVDALARGIPRLSAKDRSDAPRTLHPVERG
jgi:hypothetical protein